jgi:hypothetical protein
MIIEKLNKLENELKFLKLVLESRVGFEIDEKNWKKFSKELKISRSKTFKKTYAK